MAKYLMTLLSTSGDSRAEEFDTLDALISDLQASTPEDDEDALDAIEEARLFCSTMAEGQHTGVTLEYNDGEQTDHIVIYRVKEA